MKVKGKEKRKHHRIAFEVEAEIKAAGAKAAATKNALLVKTRNLSRNGLFVTTEKTYRPGTLLDLTLNLKPYQKLLNLTAKVIWVAKKKLHPHLYPGMGLQITRLTPANRRVIKDYVLEKTRNYKDALELQQMYFSLKNMAARLLELQERHAQAGNFKNVVDRAILEIDEVAHIIDKEVWEVRRL